MATLPLGLALLAGVLTVLSPCVLPILPIIVGRSLQSHPYGPVVLVSGLVSGFAVAGSLLGITASWFTGVANGIRLFAIVLLLVLGLLAIFPHWSDRLFSTLRIHRFQSSPSKSSPSKSSAPRGLLGEFWLGTQLGLLWTPCAGPILGSILVLAAIDHQITGAFRLLFVYGIGAALPLLAIAYGGRTISRRLFKIRAYGATLQRVGGVIVVMTAIAILLGWDVQIQLWLAPLFPNQSL